MKAVSYCKTSIILVVCFKFAYSLHADFHAASGFRPPSGKINMCAITQQEFVSTERQNDPKICFYKNIYCFITFPSFFNYHIISRFFKFVLYVTFFMCK